MKVALYIRVSTEKQEAQNQEGELKQYCLSQGYEIYKVYSDIISGAKDKRPGFDLMFQEAVKRYIQEQEGKDVFEYSIFGDVTGQSKIGDFG